jgi:hypothetical protein
MHDIALKGALVALTACFPSLLAAQEYGVDMPVNPAPGVTFPTSEDEINGWIFADPPNMAAIHQHGWGIWAGLTQPLDTPRGAETVIYQTWLQKTDVIAIFKGSEPVSDFAFGEPNQLFRHGIADGFKDTPPAPNGAGIIVNDGAGDLIEQVHYSPPAANYLLSTGVGRPEVLDRMQADGETVRFPDASVNIKPVYKHIAPDRLSTVDGRQLYAMPAWPGTPDTSGWTVDQKAAGYPAADWGACVYVDPALDGPTSVTGTDPDCDSPTEDSIYALADFIHVDLNAGGAMQVNNATGETSSLATSELSIALLVGMHVNTRENTQWTWQSFWWAADPDAPNAPSSSQIAAARPDTLTHAASHYAMTVAYSMLEPAQPLTGGSNTGELVPAYNPHLEAPFGTDVFSFTQPVYTSAGLVTTDLGVQSNCMTCHGLAAWPGNDSGYASNFYVPRDFTVFNNNLDIDFAWSVQSIGQALQGGN